MVVGQSMRVASIDCGTNSIRLLIADVSGDNFREVARDMEIVRLGQGVDKTGAFDPEAIERTLKATRKYAEAIASKGVEKIRFCATSATRDASNRQIFIDGVREIIGIEPEVIPGTEEAALSFLGATFSLPRKIAPYLVIDIGGGSTEFVFGNTEAESAKSVNIGCVRMTERHFKSNPPTKGEIENARIDIKAAIETAAREVPLTKANSIIAVAGTATTVAAALSNLGVSYETTIAALQGANVSNNTIAAALQASVPTTDSAAQTNLALALNNAGIEATAAGPNNNNNNNNNNGNNNSTTTRS